MQSNVNKSELRRIYLSKRKELLCKEEKSNLVFSSLQKIEQFEKAKTVLLYASTRGEVITTNVIPSLLKTKQVALPLCVDKCGNMDFYLIDSMDDLVEGNFGILEPNAKKCQKLTDFSNCVVIVPAIAYDKQCYRLGYGGGYYDIFLQKYNLFSIGLCYNDLLVDKLPIEEFDKSVNIVITETTIYKNN